MRVRYSPPAGPRLPLATVHHDIAVLTTKAGTVDVTADVAAWVLSLRAREGLLVVALRSSKAKLSIADAALEQTSPSGVGAAALLAGMPSSPGSMSLYIPISEGRLALSEQQCIVVTERRRLGGTRQLGLHFFGGQQSVSQTTGIG
jgi:thiamine phosphate synthase YjbQ (UPF0047 family)